MLAKIIDEHAREAMDIKRTSCCSWGALSIEALTIHFKELCALLFDRILSIECPMMVRRPQGQPKDSPQPRYIDRELQKRQIQLLSIAIDLEVSGGRRVDRKGKKEQGKKDNLISGIEPDPI